MGGDTLYAIWGVGRVALQKSEEESLVFSKRCGKLDVKTGHKAQPFADRIPGCALIGTRGDCSSDWGGWGGGGRIYSSQASQKRAKQASL